MGMTRVESARFSMLMSIPIIAVGGLFSIVKLADAPAGGAALSDGLIIAAVSFVTAYLAISFFMKLVSRIGMFPFMIYRLLLGGGLLIWLTTSGGA
jgi:undecaprenyl-diphosphatase